MTTRTVAGGTVPPMKAALLLVGRHVVTHDGRHDAALGLAVIALNIAAGLSLDQSDAAAPSINSIFWILMVAPGLAVALRRVRPISMLVFEAVLTAAAWGLGYPNLFLSGLILLYSAVVHGRRPFGLRVAIGTAIFLTLFTLLGVAIDDVPFYLVGLVGLSGAGAIALATSVENREAYTREVEQSAREAEAHRVGRVAAALADERNRLARELHDVVAHGLAVIAIQASAAERVLDRDPEAARNSLRQIQLTSRDALAEMRRVLIALRAENDAGLRPTPGLDALDQLVGTVCATGLDVDLTLDPALLIEPPNAVLAATVFRVVQEGLTNVIKHAGPHARAAVRVERAGQAMRIEVSDTGRGLSARSTQDGQGLTGMRERVELLGGTLSTGPRAGGGFRVSAALPLA
jgi:signal transduction histidine kinase